MLVHQAHRLSLEWWTPGKKVVDHHGERILVTLRPCYSVELFGRHVCWCTKDMACWRRGGDAVRQAKMGEQEGSPASIVDTRRQSCRFYVRTSHGQLLR